MSQLSKKQRKMMRRQMHERKQQQSPHGRPSGYPARDHGDRSATPFRDPVSSLHSSAPRPTTPAAATAVADATPAALPAATTPVAKWEPPAPAVRALPPVVAQPAEPDEAEEASAAAAPVVGPSEPKLPATAETRVATSAPVPAVRELDNPPPGPLMRSAASVERSVRRAIDLYQSRPWQCVALPRRAETHHSLALLIKPLRWMGCVAVAGAFALGRESRSAGVSETGSLVVLGMGLGLAVVLLALAEISAALRMLVRRR